MHPARRFAHLDELLDQVEDLCPFPAAAQRLMALTNDESASIEAIASAVSCDPALATQVLRIANSAGFRRMGTEPVRDLRRALVSIGTETVRTMAGAMALLATFATRDELSLDLHARSAVSGSIVSSLMAGSTQTERSVPFLCGLLCEVGALACLAVDGPGYLELRKRTISVTGAWSAHVALAREDLETMRYGVTTRAIGARLLRRHHLPEEIARAIEVAPHLPPYAPLLHRATAFARVATPVVVVALGLTDSTLTNQLAELAKLTSMIDIGSDELTRVCVNSAAQAERSLRAART